MSETISRGDIQELEGFLRHMGRNPHEELSRVQNGSASWSMEDVTQYLTRGTPSDDVLLGGVRYCLQSSGADVRQVLVRLLKGENSGRLRGILVDWLCEGEGLPVEGILFMIQRGSLLDRRRLLTALVKNAKPSDARVNELLKRYLRYGDQYSCASACAALVEMGPNGFTEELIYLLKKETAEPVRKAALEALVVQAADTPVLRSVLTFLAEKDRYGSVRDLARRVLTRLDPSVLGPAPEEVDC